MYIICLNQEKVKWSDEKKKQNEKKINHDTKKILSTITILCVVHNRVNKCVCQKMSLFFLVLVDVCNLILEMNSCAYFCGNFCKN